MLHLKIWAPPLLPLINWEAVTADLKSCGGKIHLMQHWMAGHTMTKALSHSYEAYLITVLQRAICLCLSFSFADICASAALSLTLSCSEPNRTQSKRSVQPLVLLHLLNYCTVQHAEVKHDSFKWIISEHLWPSTGLSLAMNQEELREKRWWARTSLKIGRIEW